MQVRFDGAAGAFAYLLFILLYFPCTAALAAIYREAGRGWTLFVAGWTTSVAYIAATLFYQGARLPMHPASSGAWLAAMAATLVLMLLALRMWSARRRDAIVMQIAE
jgi:ferrous iron transport protein B